MIVFCQGYVILIIASQNHDCIGQSGNVSVITNYKLELPCLDFTVEIRHFTVQ